jgi:hypothetical protein
MSFLTGQPYNLSSGSGIVVRIAAENSVGFGPATNEIDRGVRVIGAPTQMQQPVVSGGANSSSVIVNWDSLAGATGYITGYELYNYQQQIYTGLDTSFVFPI